MRKFLSLFAAVLVAIAVSADPVVLPATLDVNNVSFRSEGMPDFVLAEGDYAGTYFDMGAHDSANDTLLYAQWDVTIEPIMYTVGVVVYNTNSWRVQLDLLNQSDEVVKAIRYKGSSGQCGQYGIGTLDLTDLAAGNYKVRVHAATAWSAMKLKDVIFVANYAGVNVDLPGTLLPAYAELSSGATVSNNAIAFAPSTANNEFATWNVTFAEAGNFDVTIDMTASNGHTYGVALLSADGATEIGAVAEEQAWDTGVKALGSIAVPAAGSYKVKLTNATQWSEALLNSITFAAPAPAHTYTVAGSSEVAFGTIWASANTANDMEMNDDGIYVWERTELTLPVGSIEFKVCEDHGWDVAYPGSNYQLAIPEAGIYTIWIHFDPANGNQVTAGAIKTGDAVVIPTIAMHGNFTGSWADTENFTIAEGNATAALTLELAAGNYEFGMRIGGSGNWTANGAAFTRENSSAVIAAGSGNLTLAADAAGEYTFTWTYETNTLAITFPAVAPQPVEEWAEIKFAEAAAADDIAEEASYTVPGTEFALTLHDAGNKMVIDGNDCRFGTAEDYVMYNFRLKSGGASSSTKNYFTLNIPEAGILRLAPRTGSNSATDRALVIAQGETELYNAVVQESQAIEVQEGENTVKVYPYVDVTVAAGEVRVSYTAGMNFYAFAFKAVAAPQPADPTVSVRGTMNEWGETPFELSADKTYATLTIDDIPAGDYQFKMFINGEWRSNGYTFHRGFTGAAGITGNDDNNMVFQADVRGAYTFTWTFANDSLGFIYPEAPQPQGCDWDAIDYLGSTDPAYANQFKVCKPENVGVVNIQQPGFATEMGIYMTFPSAAFGTISLPESAYDIQGAGIIFHLSAFTDAYTEVTVNCEGNDLVFTVYNALGGAPELNYYMKNNWDAGADWTWKAMTKDGETYKLEKVVFGGTGVNYNTAESDEGSSWVPVANIAGDAISAKDTVTLVLDPAAGTVTATLIGKYNDPNPGEHTYTVAGNLTAAFGTSWNAADAHNDMVLNGVGIYLWEKTELTLPAGTIEFKVCEDHAWTVAYPAENYQLAIAEAGVYTIYISFNPETKEVNANATKTGDAVVTVDYYLVGSVKGWEAKAENIFTLNAEAGEGIEEYVIETTLEVGEGLKVLSSTGAWYPDGTGNEYVVDQDHAGATTIYFRPAGNAEWAAFGGYMYVVPTGGAGIDAVDANAPAVKVLRNGQILIKKGDKTYNVMGAIVR